MDMSVLHKLVGGEFDSSCLCASTQKLAQPNIRNRKYDSSTLEVSVKRWFPFNDSNFYHAFERRLVAKGDIYFAANDEAIAEYPGDPHAHF